MTKTYTAPILFCDILRQSHTLIAGRTGSGKSVMLDGILTTACKQGNNLMILIDPKRVEFRDYKNLPNTIAYANTSAEALAALRKASSIMEQRYEQMERKGEKLYSGDPLLVVIDELFDLFVSKDGREIKAEIMHLTALGRAAKIKCIFASQSPSKKILSAEITLNIPSRIALSCQTAIESRQIINVNGAEQLPMYGECLYLRPGHDLECWEVPLTSEAEKLQAIADCREMNASYDNRVINLFRKII